MLKDSALRSLALKEQGSNPEDSSVYGLDATRASTARDSNHTSTILHVCTNLTCFFSVQSLENPESMMIYYVVLRGVEKFQAEYNSYPGEFDDQVEPDIVKLKVICFK